MNASDRRWALILGASSGFGGATAVELARNGYSIFGVHLDRRDTLPNAERVQEQIRAAGGEAIFFNANAGDPETVESVIAAIRQRVGQQHQPPATDLSPVRVMLHSIAFGTLKRYIGQARTERVSEKGLNMTLHLMANTLVYWVQALLEAGLLGHGGRIFAMTSSGGHRVWHSYGAVSAAKAALESHVRQLALELAPLGVTVNAIQAGVTDTPALRKIPDYQQMIEYACRINPHRRLTTVEDVARAIVVLADERTQWITGNVIRVDGGEDIVG
ncbi:MAG: enoyl-ACP reductase [Phycisphaerae bacterium]